jgi:hypothetical protein
LAGDEIVHFRPSGNPLQGCHSGKEQKMSIETKSMHIISEVDLLIARLKRFRKGQRTGFDLREAIEDGRD